MVKNKVHLATGSALDHVKIASLQLHSAKDSCVEIACIAFNPEDKAESFGHSVITNHLIHLMMVKCKRFKNGVAFIELFQ